MRKLPFRLKTQKTILSRAYFLSITVSLLFVTLIPINGASATDGKIYWVVQTAGDRNNIGAADLTGANISENYISGLVNFNTTAWSDGSILIYGEYVYWTSKNKILRAKKDASGSIETIYEDSIKNLNIHGLARDANHLYWSTEGNNVSPWNGAIGRSNLDGSEANPRFIEGTSIDHTHGNVEQTSLFVTSNYIYWTNYWNGTIGRATIDGLNVNRSFISDPVGSPSSVWVTGSYIYWAAPEAYAIGRANLDGTSKNANFISTGGGYTRSIFVTDEYIYWSTWDSTIGRAAVSGGSINSNFIVLGSGRPMGVVVDFPAPAPTPSLTIDPVAAAKAAAEARALAVEVAKTEIKSVLASGKPLTANQLLSADFNGVTAKNVGLVNADIAKLPDADKTDLKQIEKVVLKFATVDKLAEGKTVYPSDLIAVGLIPQDSKIKSSITSALKKIPASSLDSFEKIQAVVASVQKTYDDRKSRLAAILAKRR